MTRQGYDGELRAKKELQYRYGKHTVIKIAIAQTGADFMVIEHGKLILLVEVKETIKDKYYPDKIQKRQLQRIKEFAEVNNCTAQLWIYYKKGYGKKTKKEIKSLNLANY